MIWLKFKSIFCLRVDDRKDDKKFFLHIFDLSDYVTFGSSTYLYAYLGL